MGNEIYNENLASEIPPSAEWWFRKPTLIINKNVFNLQGRQLTSEEIAGLINPIFDGIIKNFEKNACPVKTWEKGRLAEVPEKLIVLNPVFLGEIPQEVISATSFADFERSVRDFIPENYPLAKSVGVKGMGLGKLHPNFFNVIFLNVPGSFLKQLDLERKTYLNRALLAKQGAFKNILVFYEDSGSGYKLVRIDLATLEGGYKEFFLDQIDELSRRLMVFGSAKEVGGIIEVSGEITTYEKWKNSRTVNSLIELGRFLGERGLISPPVEVEQLVSYKPLARLIQRSVGWGRQAEGALYAWDPELGHIVTASGRFGAVKDRLGLGDITRIKALPNGKVGVIPVEGINHKGASQEAEEFIFPQEKLANEGYCFNIGGVTVPPYRGIIHLHRDFVAKGNRVGVISTDHRKFPPVGCGVDLMQKMSEDAMRRGIEDWKNSERQLVCLLFYVPNHGTNIFIPWTKDGGEIPEDPFELFKKVVENGEIQFVKEIRQV